MQKAWLMAPMEYNPNEKGIIVPMEKAWFYKKTFFEVLIVMVKDNKIQHERYNVNQN